MAKRLTIAERIRRILVHNPDARPKAIVERLTKQGHKVTNGQVYGVKHIFKKKFPGKGSKRNSKRLNTTLEQVVAQQNRHSEPSALFSDLQKVLQIQRQIKEIGVDNVKLILSALEE